MRAMMIPPSLPRPPLGRPNMRIRIAWLISCVSRFLDNFDELIERFPPTLMKSHLFVFLARFFVTVENERRVLCSISLGFKRNEHGKEECNAGHRLRRFAWPVAGREGIGPNELFVLDEFEVATNVHQLLSLR